MKMTMQDLETRKATELNILKEELTHQCMLMSKAEDDLLGSKRETQEQRDNLVKLDKLTVMVKQLNKWRTSRINTFFRTWNTNAILTQVAGQFRQQIEFMMKRQIDQMNQEKVDALDTLTKQMLREFADREAVLAQEHEERMMDTVRYEQLKYQEALSAAQDEYKRQLETAESDFLFDLTALENKVIKADIARYMPHYISYLPYLPYLSYKSYLP
jgi:hypothetical protein